MTRFFLFTIYLAILIVFGLVVSFLLNSAESLLAGDYSSFFISLKATLNSVRSYFSAADAWNYLAMVGLLSVLLLIFSLSSIIFHYSLTKIQSESARWFVGKLLSCVLTLILFILFTNYLVLHYSTERIFDHPGSLKKKTSVLLLGTKKILDGGHINSYYQGRIDAVVELYQTGKIERIIISGDHTGDYNEPLDMMLDLIKEGIPSEIIIRDDNGFRTLDSIVRIKTTFGVDRVVIVSQEFHLHRALFLAWFYDVVAIGYRAPGKMTDKMVRRELLAKPNLFLDVFVLNTQPAIGKTSARSSWSGYMDDVALLLLVLMLLFGALYITYLSFQLSSSHR